MISRLVIDVPNNIDIADIRTMLTSTVYIGDSSDGNGNSNAMCEGILKANVNSDVIEINCTNTPAGKYMYIVAGNIAGAALFLTEISLYGCEGDCAIICVVSLS